METRFEVETALGPVWFWGRDTGRPILLVISGAFNAANYFWKLQRFFDDADVLRAHLPGNHCPELAETELAAFAKAYSEAVSSRWPDRPIVVLGASTGGLVAFALRIATLRRLVVIEPPLLTAGVWPLHLFKDQTPSGGEALVWNLFGVGPDRIEPRDHTWSLAGLTVPALVLVGDDMPGPPRAFVQQPSFVSEDARVALRTHPLVTLRTVAGAGHNIPAQAGPQMHAAVVETWRAARLA